MTWYAQEIGEKNREKEKRERGEKQVRKNRVKIGAVFRTYSFAPLKIRVVLV